MVMMVIEVAYATPERQAILTVTVPEGTDVRTCIERSGIMQQFAEINLEEQKLAFGARQQNSMRSHGMVIALKFIVP